METQRLTAITKADSTDVLARCLCLAKYKQSDGFCLPQCSSEPCQHFTVEVFTLVFTSGCNDTLTLSCFHPNYCMKARTQDVVHFTEPGTPMTTAFDLRHRGRNYLHDRRAEVSSRKLNQSWDSKCIMIQINLSNKKITAV